jgi:hypothetical protein
MCAESCSIRKCITLLTLCVSNLYLQLLSQDCEVTLTTVRTLNSIFISKANLTYTYETVKCSGLLLQISVWPWLPVTGIRTYTKEMEMYAPWEMWGIGHVVVQMYNLSTKWGEWSASCPSHFSTLKEFLLPIK